MPLKECNVRSLKKVEEHNYAIAPLVLGGLIAAGGSLLSGAISSSGQSSANKTNMDIARMQNAWNLEQWNRENEYNTPSAQVQRLRDAGLNPALMYGSGSGVTSAATSPRAASATVENASTGYAQGISQATGMMMQTIMNQQEISKMQAQSELAKTQADLARMNTNVQTVRSGLYAAQTAQTYSNIDVNSARISNLMSQTSLNEVRAIGQRITNENLPENYRLQQELRQTAISLNNEQIRAIGIKLAQTWKALEISEGRYQNDSSRAFWQSHLWEQQIENLRSGASLNDVKTEMLRIGVGYEDANQIVGMIGKILGGVSTAASAF